MKTTETDNNDLKPTGKGQVNLFWPTLIIGGGVMLLLKAFGIGEEFDAYRILGSLLLFALAIGSLVRFNFFMFLVPLSLVVYLWRTQLGIADLNMKWLLAATVLISIGLSLIFRRKSGYHWQNRHHGDWAKGDWAKGDWSKGDWAKSEEILNENEFVNIESNFGEYTKYIHANNLKKVRISSSFSSTKVYFDPCQISPEGLEIDLSVNFSGVILMIPKTWRISSQASVFAGTITDMTSRSTTAENTVRLTGSVNFAEVKVIEI